MVQPIGIMLTDQVAVVTGAGAGIGQACALRMAAFGADIVVADIVPERCEDTAAQVRELGRRALPVPIDVMDTGLIRLMVAAADAEFGRIDILVNNAGGVALRPFLDQSERSWRRHIDINLVSMLAATAAAAPIMIRGERGGSIINIATVEAFRAAPLAAVYGACKAGMVNFTKTMAIELSSHRIRVNCIAPDHTLTPGSRGNRSGPVDPSTWRVQTAAETDALARLVPLGREGVDTECADTAVWLSSQMASYVTGAVLPVDGGTSAAGGWHRGSDGHWTLIEPQAGNGA